MRKRLQNSTTPPTIKDDVFTDDGNYNLAAGFGSGSDVSERLPAAVVISGSNVDLGLLRGDTGTGGEPGIESSDHSVVTVSSTQTFSGLPMILGCARSDLYGAGSLDIAKGVTATFGSGKRRERCKPRLLSDRRATSRRQLDASGTSTDPVTFTSISENSVGGDTGVVPPKAGDWQGIVVSDVRLWRIWKMM